MTMDKSNGYEQIAENFINARNRTIGVQTVSQWSKKLSRGSSILDLGCGDGVPISQALIDEGFAVYGVDASAKMIAAFHKHFPNAPAECSTVEDSAFFSRTFDGVVAWGLIFLMPPDIQRVVLRKVGHALNAGGKFLYTAPKEAVAWSDALTGRQSISLGADVYQRILRAEGLILAGELSDDGDNHYYCVEKPIETVDLLRNE
jgi:2-polyprenyl-3-methyl-5-hydroxy-6-metoxy-1,4-benzoquinol methylase